MKDVTFGFDEVGPFPGRTDGTYWNGFLNVEVTAETHKKVIAEFKKLDGCADDDYEGDDELFGGLEPDEDGWVSYAFGFATSEWEED